MPLSDSIAALEGKFSILGKVEFDTKGDVKGSGFVMWTIKDGKLQVLPDSP